MNDRPLLFLHLLIFLMAITVAGCGDDSGNKDPHVELFGSQSTTFGIAAGDLDVSCKKKPCSTVAAGCKCSCKCASCTTEVNCKTGCISSCDTMCQNACLDKSGCGDFGSSSGDCPAKKTECLYGAFEFAAETDMGKDKGKYFRFTVADFDPNKSKTYDLKHDFNSVFNSVSVGFENSNKKATTDNDFKYVYYTERRADDPSKTYPSQCSIEITPKTTDNATTYSGSLYCTMLWADSISHDYAKGSNLNVYVDLWGRYSCTIRK